MLSKQDNELVTRVGPGTPMGNLFRQYWVHLRSVNDHAIDEQLHECAALVADRSRSSRESATISLLRKPHNFVWLQELHRAFYSDSGPQSASAQCELQFVLVREATT